MAGGEAGMTTLPGPGAGQAARCIAAAARRGVAGGGAGVHPTRQPSPARPAAADALQVTGDVATGLVAAVALPGGEGGAGRAGRLAVAAVHHRVTAAVLSAANLPAVGRPGPAGYRREHHRRPALAGKLLETDLRAGSAVTRVAQRLALVFPAGEKATARQGANVLGQDAADLAALVLSTASLFSAALAAPGVIRPGGQLGTSQLLVHVAATAPNQRGAWAGRTSTCVAEMCAGVRLAGRATLELTTAHQSAYRDGVRAGSPLHPELLQAQPPAGAVCYPI